MRILRLVFENINALKGRHEIDFEGHPAFRASQLFAITGPTGAGKTTILDVITLALYARIPRLPDVLSLNALDTLGAILTRDTYDALAEVSFACASGRFRARWSLTRRPVKRGERKGQMELEEKFELTDLATDVPIYTKKTEYLDEIRQLIGLDYGQFVKAVMLSQGDFAAFLKAKPDERSQLLEKIAGTDIYRTIGKLAFENAKIHTEEIERLHAEIAHLSLLSPEELTSTIETINQKKNLRESLELQKKQQTEALNIRQLLEENRAKFIRLTSEELPFFEAEKKIFDVEIAPKLAQNQAVQVFAQPLAELNAQQNELGLLRENILQKQTEKNTAIEQQTNLLTALAQWLGQEVLPTEVSHKIAIFQEELTVQFTQLEVLKTSIEQTRQQAANLVVGLSVESAFQNRTFTACQEKTQTLLDTLQNEQISAHKALQITDNEEVDLLKKQLETQREALVKLEAEVRVFEQNRQTEQVQKQEIRLLEAFVQQQKEPLEVVKKNVLFVEQSLQSVREKQLDFIRNSAIPQLRAKLLPTEPCPVCGAVEHPDFTEKSSDNSTEISVYLIALDSLKKEVITAEEKQKSIERTRTEIERTLADASTKIQNHQNRLAELAKYQEEIIAKIQGIKTTLGLEKVGKSDDIRAALAANTEARQALENFQKRHEQISRLTDFFGHLSRHNSDAQAYQQLRGQVQQRFVGDLLALQRESMAFLEKFGQRQYQPEVFQVEITTLSEQLQTKEKQYKELNNRLLMELLPLGIASISAAMALQLSPETAQRYEADRTRLLSREAQLQHTKTEFEAAIAQLLARENAEITTDEISAQLALLSEALQLVSEEIGGLQKQLDDHTANAKKAEKQQAIITQKEKAYHPAILLAKSIGDKEGKNFNKFAQQLTLTNLIKTANLRLRELSDRYLLVPPLGDDATLRILDTYFDEQRAVTTLSGGETFLVSLALALGLSDTVAQRVRIESLFIDEGFGTLDPLTLESVIDTLEKLQADGQRHIGVISHVEALKERIGTQIQLQKRSNGFSTMKIVG